MTVRKLPRREFDAALGPISHAPPDERVSKEPKQRMLTYALTKPRNIEGYVTLTQLAAEKGMQAQLARIYLHRAKIKKPPEGWRWPMKSAALKKARQVLGLV